jgi:hypothetical protein
MSDKRRQELTDAPTPKTFISEATDFVVRNEPVDFVVKETALDRARRRWGMDERKEPTDVH